MLKNFKTTERWKIVKSFVILHGTLEAEFGLENLEYVRCLFEVGEGLNPAVACEASRLGLCLIHLASSSAGSLVDMQRQVPESKSQYVGMADPKYEDPYWDMVGGAMG